MLRRLVAVVVLGVGCGSTPMLPSDGGERDGGGVPSDAGSIDAGGSDAGLTDAGSDAGRADAGTFVDAGQPQAVFLIGGQDERRLVSFDGRTWVSDDYIAPNGEDNAFSTVFFGNHLALMSGDPGIFRSADAVQWTLALARPSRFSFHSSQGAYGNGLFVVVGGAAAYRSADAITWQTAATTGNSGHWQGLAFGNGHFIAIGDGHHKVSEDAIIWHDYNATADPDALGAIAFGNGVFVAVGGKSNMGRVVTTTDGVVWNEQALIATQYNTGFGGVAFGNGHFLTSDCCNAFESPDGVTWTKRGKGGGGSLAFAGGTFIGAGWRTNAVVYNPDAGAMTGTFSGNMPDKYLTDGGLWPWFTSVGAGELLR